MFYPEGSLSPIGFIICFILIACLIEFARGIIAGITGNQKIRQKKLGWFRIFIGFFIIYLILNWADIAANTWRGYISGLSSGNSP